MADHKENDINIKACSICNKLNFLFIYLHWRKGGSSVPERHSLRHQVSSSGLLQVACW